MDYSGDMTGGCQGLGAFFDIKMTEGSCSGFVEFILVAGSNGIVILYRECWQLVRHTAAEWSSFCFPCHTFDP